MARSSVCEWPGCGNPSEEADHIIPRIDGGGHTPENGWALCRTHHRIKTARDRRNRGKAW